MDKEHVKGAADKAKGAMKDAAGKMTGDKKLQAEGKMDKAKGEAHQALGDVKDAAKRASDDLGRQHYTATRRLPWAASAALSFAERASNALLRICQTRKLRIRMV